MSSRDLRHEVLSSTSQLHQQLLQAVERLDQGSSQSSVQHMSEPSLTGGTSVLTTSRPSARSVPFSSSGTQLVLQGLSSVPRPASTYTQPTVELTTHGSSRSTSMRPSLNPSRSLLWDRKRPSSFKKEAINGNGFPHGHILLFVCQMWNKWMCLTVRKGLNFCLLDLVKRRLLWMSIASPKKSRANLLFNVRNFQKPEVSNCCVFLKAVAKCYRRLLHRKMDTLYHIWGQLFIMQ